VTVAAHGALFLAWKTEGPVYERSRALVKPLWAAVVGLWIAATIATRTVSPEIYTNFPGSFLALLFFVVYLAGLATVFYGIAKDRFLLAFLGSGAFILGILATTAACVWPVMLKSTLGPALSLTAQNSSVGGHGLRVGLVWWLIGFPIVIGYFSLLFRIHRGKAKAAPEGEGY
jgi:cytochrome d ubiquinol oxidase subunit II